MKIKKKKNFQTHFIFNICPAPATDTAMLEKRMFADATGIFVLCILLITIQLSPSFQKSSLFLPLKQATSETISVFIR